MKKLPMGPLNWWLAVNWGLVVEKWTELAVCFFNHAVMKNCQQVFCHCICTQCSLCCSSLCMHLDTHFNSIRKTVTCFYQLPVVSMKTSYNKLEDLTHQVLSTKFREASEITQHGTWLLSWDARDICLLHVVIPTFYSRVLVYACGLLSQLAAKILQTSSSRCSFHKDMIIQIFTW